ncbi:Ubiquitin carboxyl-terminal hydrolase 48 [Fasciolopsis buskii]|uniref:ubiquitinyl hydrolase 1 n=1 Tax=Fasciolopsis buskii TaxID=27845 RepID=A0A8E0RPA2_9TREM|nr:Ubiquitin carboxyl-terminal hydrolase 48 [Fasciolopsis buski]
MNLLEARFREYGLSIVDDLFRGEIVYETICLNCGFTSKQPSKFLELSLKVSSSSLIGCISDYLKEEPLVGENRYACSYCGGKQDGIRRVYITRAPSLLCVQLLRFTYDPRTGQRKKSKATIRLPDTLELSALSPTSSCNQSDHAAACLIPGVGKERSSNVQALRCFIAHWCSTHFWSLYCCGSRFHFVKPTHRFRES